MNILLGEFDDDKVNDALIGIEAINTYNFNNQKSIIIKISTKSVCGL